MNENVLASRIAEGLGLTKETLITTVKNTVFKKATDAQLMVFFGMCDQLNFNPFAKMIWAYPDKDGGVQTMISYSGWIQIANNHPQFDGEETTFVIDEQTKKPISATCYVWRKDRTHPTIVTVYYNEWYKGSNPNWVDRPIHMLGIRAYVQAVRKAFGLHQYDYEGCDFNESTMATMKDVTPTQEAANNLTKMIEDTPVETIPTEIPPVVEKQAPVLVGDELPSEEPKRRRKVESKPEPKPEPKEEAPEPTKEETQPEPTPDSGVDKSVAKLYKICQDMFAERKDNPELPEAQKGALVELLENGVMGKYNNIEELTKIKLWLERYQPHVAESDDVPDPDPEVAAMAALWSN